MNNKKRIYGNILAPGIIIGIISIVLAAVAIGISVADLAIRLGKSKGSNGGSIVSNYKVNEREKNYNIITNRGRFTYGVRQSNGKLNAKYRVEYKRVNGRKFFLVSNHTFSKNETPEVKNWGKVKKNINYVFKFIKSNNFNTESTFIMDWLID